MPAQPGRWVRSLFGRSWKTPNPWPGWSFRTDNGLLLFGPGPKESGGDGEAGREDAEAADSRSDPHFPQLPAQCNSELDTFIDWVGQNMHVACKVSSKLVFEAAQGFALYWYDYRNTEKNGASTAFFKIIYLKPIWYFELQKARLQNVLGHIWATGRSLPTPGPIGQQLSLAATILNCASLNKFKI